MKIGQKVTRIPETFFEREEGERKKGRVKMTGTVVFIHPRGRFHTVEFKTRGGVLRESFQGV